MGDNSYIKISLLQLTMNDVVEADETMDIGVCH